MVRTERYLSYRHRMASFEIGKTVVLLVLLLGTFISSGSRVSNSSSSINHIGMSHIYDLDELDDIITTYMRERKIPGASVAISKGGQFLMRKGYGRASAQRLMTPWALMRIGSVSKIVTAVSILRLHDEGRLELDSKVFGSKGILREYDVERDSRSESGALQNITVRHLLQHTAGWDHRQIGDPLFQKDLSTTTAAPSANASTAALGKESSVRFMLNQSLQYTPGTRYSYSNFGYMLLGLVVEKVAGVPYESYTRDLLRLLGIYRMKIGRTLKEEADVSEVEYFSPFPQDQVRSVLNSTKLVPPPYGGFNMAVIDSSCGWISSASDLVRLLESLVDPSPYSRSIVALLSNSTVQQMLARPSYTNASVWYGLGLVVEEGGQAFWHSGTLDGSTSIVSHDEYGFTWAALLNCKLDPNDLGDFMRYAIRRVFLDGPLTAGGREPPHENSLNSIMPNRQSSVVDSTSSDGRNIVKLMIPDYKFADVLTTVSPRLYRLAWIDAYEELGYIFFNAVWTQNDGTRWRAYFDLTSSRYRKRFKARVAQGYRLVHVETYVSKRRLRYAAIFFKDEWPEWTAYESYSPQRHKTEFFRLLEEGYRLVVQSVTEYKGRVYIAAIYDKIFLGEIRVRLGLTLDEFTDELEKQLASGRILSYVQSYENRGLLRFSAVWSPRTTRYWAVSQAMTKYMLLNKLHEYAVVNVPLSCVTAYHNDEVLQFAALWR